MSVQSKMAFAKWLHKNEPQLFAVALRRMEIAQGSKNLGSLNSINWGAIGNNISNFFTTVADSAQKLVPAALQYKAQSKILGTQLKRAEQGLPPLNVPDYAPVIRIAPEITPETEAAITRAAVETAKTGMSNLMPVALIAGGALTIFLLSRRR